MVINFPKRIKYAKDHPLYDFYSKCMKLLGNSGDITGVQVWAFSIHPKDEKILKDLLKKHIKKNYPYIPYTKLAITIGMEILNLGPRLDKKVERGTVEIDLAKIYSLEDHLQKLKKREE
jgi:hypothetical protein